VCVCRWGSERCPTAEVIRLDDQIPQRFHQQEVALHIHNQQQVVVIDNAVNRVSDRQLLARTISFLEFLYSRENTEEFTFIVVTAVLEPVRVISHSLIDRSDEPVTTLVGTPE
jgi:hypothetical protein